MLPCRGRSGGSRWSMVDHRRVSTPVKASHHPSSWCRFVGSGLLVHHVEVWRRAQRDPVFAYGRCTRRRTQAFSLRCSENSSDVTHGDPPHWVVCHPTICTAIVAAFTALEELAVHWLKFVGAVWRKC